MCAGRCVEAGASRVVVAPYFLSRGRHIQEDIPALVAAAQEQFPGITCSIADPIGEQACRVWLTMLLS
jgi:sirohydrochlorin ferrochelatase